MGDVGQAIGRAGCDYRAHPGIEIPRTNIASESLIFAFSQEFA
jgi:hypothetical protein